MNSTKIEWVKNPDGTQGYTWNPITGCLNGCGYCYARKLANTRLKERYLANRNVALVKPLPYGERYSPVNARADLTLLEAHRKDPFYPRFWRDRVVYDLGAPDSQGYQRVDKAKGIFVCDMSDLFGVGIPGEWTAKVLTKIKEYPEHRFYLLTKQPQNLQKFSPFPDNCWVGVTVTNEGITYPDMMEEACRALAEIKAAVKYLSFEPLLSSIYKLDLLKIWGINWVIIGALTGTLNDIKKSAMQYPDLTLMPFGKKWTLQPKIEWVKEIVEACDKAGIPVFLKDNLKPLLRQNDYNVHSFPEWAGKQFAVTGDRSLAPTNPHPNEPMRKLRQEMPK